MTVHLLFWIRGFRAFSADNMKSVEPMIVAVDSNDDTAGNMYPDSGDRHRNGRLHAFRRRPHHGKYELRRHGREHRWRDERVRLPNAKPRRVTRRTRADP